ncbi:stage II sporulation protein M [Pyrococcus sp. ST04]|uniref:stage II sporulation protein M n=1 Tax=Pyrococcus sp. ST04 TaxID=1183377 RepID=UPI0002605975|nr:stage II sporulation protein M [Pyrococcus sp. ST04]AFK21798.1 hypothetical protein Py04_0194 [Pyrococcus sp. ST04]
MKKSQILFCFSFLLFSIGFLLGLSLSKRYEIPHDVNFVPLLEREINSEMPTFHYILTNNLRVILLLSFGGTLALGGLTFLNLIFNGMDLGTLFYGALISGELKAFFFLILPHGIFEIPGMIIAGAAGFKIPYELLRFALGKKKEIITEEDAKEFFKLVAISVVLIFIAALIESTITLKIAESLG